MIDIEVNLQLILPLIATFSTSFILHIFISEPLFKMKSNLFEINYIKYIAGARRYLFQILPPLLSKYFYGHLNRDDSIARN